MIRHHISLAFRAPKSGLSYKSPESALAAALSDFGLSLGNKIAGSEKGIYTWQINTPEGTPLEKLRLGFDEKQEKFVLDDGENTVEDTEPDILLRSIRLSPTVGLKDPAI